MCLLMFFYVSVQNSLVDVVCDLDLSVSDFEVRESQTLSVSKSVSSVCSARNRNVERPLVTVVPEAVRNRPTPKSAPYNKQCLRELHFNQKEPRCR